MGKWVLWEELPFGQDGVNEILQSGAEFLGVAQAVGLEERHCPYHLKSVEYVLPRL